MNMEINEEQTNDQERIRRQSIQANIQSHQLSAEEYKRVQETEALLIINRRLIGRLAGTSGSEGPLLISATDREALSAALSELFALRGIHAKCESTAGHAEVDAKALAKYLVVHHRNPDVTALVPDNVTKDEAAIINAAIGYIVSADRVTALGDAFAQVFGTATWKKDMGSAARQHAYRVLQAAIKDMDSTGKHYDEISRY